MPNDVRERTANTPPAPGRAASADDQEAPSPPRIDYRGADLRGANMAGMNKEHADFRGADLRGVNFTGSNLRYADFRGANVVGANFQQASLYGAKMQGVEAFHADFRNSDLRKANFGGAYLGGAFMPPLERLATPGELARQPEQDTKSLRASAAETLGGGKERTAGQGQPHSPPRRERDKGRGRGR